MQTLQGHRRQRPVSLAMVIIMLAGCLLWTKRASAHEFWLEVSDYTPATSEPVHVWHMTGQNFAGTSYPYLAEMSQRFAMVSGTGENAISAIDGDDPAGTLRFETQGLKIVVHQRAFSEIIFDGFEDFRITVEAEHLPEIAERHKASGKRMKHIREFYARFAKALVGVGHAQGNDRALGLEFELVALRNPYELAPGEPLPVQVLYKGAPVAGVPVKRLSSADAGKPVVYRSGPDGIVNVDLPKPADYMLNAVRMREPLRGEEAEWVSLWASLIFQIQPEPAN